MLPDNISVVEYRICHQVFRFEMQFHILLVHLNMWKITCAAYRQGVILLSFHDMFTDFLLGSVYHHCSRVILNSRKSRGSAVWTVSGSGEYQFAVSIQSSRQLIRTFTIHKTTLASVPFRILSDHIDNSLKKELVSNSETFKYYRASKRVVLRRHVWERCLGVIV